MKFTSQPSPCVGIRTCSDYSPFGVELDGRMVSGGYRFGYQGSEKDNEFKGNGNSYTTEFRQLDPRLGRWLSVDPLFEKYSWQSPYCAFNNCSILLCDPLGLEAEGGPDDDKKGNKITSKVQETREVVVKGYPTKEQRRQRFWNRVWGGVSAFFGTVEASIGSGLIASGVGTPLGVIMLLHGADIVVAGGNQMITGRKQETLTFKETKQLVKSCGAREHRAEDIARFVDCSISIVGLGGGALVKQSMTKSAPKIGIEIVEESGKLTLRSDIILSGGRSGQLVKNLTGPANSVLKGSGQRIFITDDIGNVIWDVTKDRAKSVIPGQGFGPKVTPTQQQIDLLNKVWGN